MLALIDNYDSFSHNLARYFVELNVPVQVYRNNQITIQQLRELADKKAMQGLVISPGPCTPNEAGISLQGINEFAGEFPILGVCLGHQALSRSEGIEVARQNESTQGLQRLIEIQGSPKKLAFYNSFSPIYTQEAVETSGIEFDVDNEGRILALYGEDFTGFQFHPESVMSPDGYDLIIGAVKDLLGCKS